MAARQLRWPEGSVKSRLSRGRQLLAQRLTKRGVSLTAGSLFTALTSKTATASGLKTLYDEFRQDEPWDSEHNHKLLAKMPKIFASTGKAPPLPNSTFYQVFVGEGCLFETGKEIVAARDVTDGTCNTVAVITAPTAVPWTKPADLSYQPGQKLPALVGGMFDDGLISFATACGNVHIAPNTISNDLRTLIVRNDGGLVDFEALVRGNSK
jgi:hypothetical protein